MDPQGNSRLSGHPDQPPHPLDQLKSRPKENCRHHVEYWCFEMYKDVKDMGKSLKSLKNAFRPKKEAKEEAQQNRERAISQFLNSNGRNPNDHTFRVLPPKSRIVLG